MDHIYVLRKPMVTEKSTVRMENNQYSFEVDGRADKTQIKAAVEELYKVKVVSVNTQVRKNRARRLKYGLTPGKVWKVAVVRLQEGDKIDLLT